MKCPHDGTELTANSYEAEIQVDTCLQCGGSWLDKGELEKVQETIENDYRAELNAMPNSMVEAYKAARGRGPGDELECPSCDGKLHQKEHGFCSQIYIDVCTACRGVWLDDGELKQLELFFERSKLDTKELRQGFWASLRDLVLHGVIPPD